MMIRSDSVEDQASRSDERYLFLNESNTFTSSMMYWTSSFPQSIAVRSFNSNDNNRVNIVITNLENDGVSVLLGYGNDSFVKQIMYSSDVSFTKKKRKDS
jgi:hypothetical protein